MMIPIFAMLNAFEVVVLLLVVFAIIVAGVYLIGKLITKR
jgi:flagellar biogenesis protein FliO